MARFDRMAVLNKILELGLVPVFYHEDVEVAKQIVTACAAGGAQVVEFTNRGDFAPQVFMELAQRFARAAPDVILGVGSVVDAPTAALYIAYGANFVVGPVLNPEVARLCNRRKIAYSPGCGSASEIAEAEELGVEIVKVFPGSSVGGPAFRQVGPGPLPLDAHHAHRRRGRHARRASTPGSARAWPAWASVQAWSGRNWWLRETMALLRKTLPGSWP